MSNSSRQRFHAVANGRINGVFYNIWENMTSLIERVEEPVVKSSMASNHSRSRVLDVEAEDILGLMYWNQATPSKPQNVKITKPMSPKYKELKEKCRLKPWTASIWEKERLKKENEKMCHLTTKTK